MRAALRDDEGDAEDMRFKKRGTGPKSKGASTGPTPDELEAEDQDIRDDLDPGSSQPRRGKGRGRGRGSMKRQRGKDSGLNHWNFSMTHATTKGVLSTARLAIAIDLGCKEEEAGKEKKQKFDYS